MCTAASEKRQGLSNRWHFVFSPIYIFLCDQFEIRCPFSFGHARPRPKDALTVKLRSPGMRMLQSAVFKIFRGRKSS